MKRFLFSALLAGVGLPLAAQEAVPVDREKYPDYNSVVNPDPSLLSYGFKAREKGLAVQPVSERPDHVNNALTKYFPPVFNQAGGSCGSASRICYMFTYELAAYRDVDASLNENNYPSHFVWLWTNNNTGKDEFVQYVGVPSSALYGGRTYSAKFGYQDTENDDYGWTSGYDIWYAGMFNRMLKPTNFSVNVGTAEGREAVKNYLWNHNGDPDFRGTGGIVGLGCASGGDWQRIPQTAANDAAGVTGQYFVNHWGRQVDHAVTLVGYDDRIEFDLNGDGVYGDEAADEKGAWIIANSWGDGWCNGGLIYCPYAYAGPVHTYDEATNTWSFPGNWFQPEIYTVRKDYRPLRTIRLKMDYSRRSEIYLSAGVSADVNATAPEATVPLEPFKYAGDGNWGNTNPAPEVPMQGRWADGTLHTEPIEIGYDLTDLTGNLDRSKPLKYFFTVETRSWGKGSGHIYEATVVDYEEDLQGIEIPFDFGDESQVEIKSAGNKTIISVVVPGLPYYAPVNAAISGNILSWGAPRKGPKTLAGYKVSKDGAEVATVSPTTLSYNIGMSGEGVYTVKAIYEGGGESTGISAHTPIPAATPGQNPVLGLAKSGFTVPDVFASHYDNATIEFWIRPNSLSNWNQSVGNWGSFMFHAYSDGSMSAGWATNARLTSEHNTLKVGEWTHIAIVVRKGNVTLYANGMSKGSASSKNNSGIGGFGDLVFGTSNEDNHMDCDIAELRIWDRYFTLRDLRNETYKFDFSGEVLPEHLIAYYKGDTFNTDGVEYLRDCVGGHHAPIFDKNFENKTDDLKLTSPTADLAVSVVAPEKVVANIPAVLTAERPSSASSLVWNVPDAGIKDVHAASVSVRFAKPGQYTAQVTAANAAGQSVTSEATITVEAAPAPDASFTATSLEVATGQRLSVKVDNPREDCTYSWEMPGATPATSTGAATGLSYENPGEYDITLTVTAADGRTARTKRTVAVNLIAPEADFTVSPAVVVKGNTVRIADKSKWNPSAWNWTVKTSGASYIGSLKNLDFTPTEPGVYDISLTAANEAGSGSTTQNRVLTVTNADSKNGLTFTPQGASVAVSKPVSPDAELNAFTIEWWMNPGKLSNYCIGFGDTGETFRMCVSVHGAIIVNAGGNETYSRDGVVIANQWHHYALTFYNGLVRVFRDGVSIQQLSTIKTRNVGKLENFKIGTADAPMTGSIDEFRIWGKRLLPDELPAYINQPLEGDLLATAKENGLLLYYDFNQSRGDVEDKSGNANTGVRNGFGPEGDAWGLSSGVFCLNFGNDMSADVSAEYLNNWKRPFSRGASINAGNTRWRALKDWTIENAVEEGNVISGAHVDSQKDNCMTFTTQWDGFADALENHKVYQTVTLPKGMYTFTAEYSTTHVCDHHDTYLVAAEGAGLPDYAEIGFVDGVTAMKMLDRGDTDDARNSIIFVVEEPTEISLGMVMNLKGKNCVNFEKFTLVRSDINVITTGDNEGSGIVEITTGNGAAVKGIYDLQGRKLDKASAPGIYIINGKKVLVK